MTAETETNRRSEKGNATILWSGELQPQYDSIFLFARVILSLLFPLDDFPTTIILKCCQRVTTILRKPTSALLLNTQIINGFLSLTKFSSFGIKDGKMPHTRF